MMGLKKQAGRFCILVLCFTMSLSAHAIDWSFTDLDGKKQQLSDYKGKWILVNFWATWCPPCLEELPDLSSFHDEHVNKDAVVIGVNYEDISAEKLSLFVDEYLLSYPIVPVSASAKTPFGGILGLPTTFLIDPQGKPAARQDGPVTAEMIEKFMKSYKK